MSERQAPQVVVSHWGANQNVRAVLDSLARQDRLAVFWTTIAWSSRDRGPFARRLPERIRAAAAPRSVDLPRDKIAGRPRLEAARLASGRLARHGWGRRVEVSVDRMIADLDAALSRRLPSLVADGRVGAVYAYEDGALDTFRVARGLGMTCVYDLPIAYWAFARELMLIEAERLPEWGPALGGGEAESSAKLDRKAEELALADLVSVPSEFVRSSLPPGQGTPVVVAPFGSPTATHGGFGSPDRRGGPLRVLFAGSMTQRKGLADLFAAISLLRSGGEDVELVVLGMPATDLSFYTRFANFTYENPRPHAAALELMSTCDVLCLPSIYEGRALVMQEAMSRGLPIVITENTGGADLVIEGVTGFVVPIRSPEAIARHLAWMAQHRSDTAEMGRRAAEHASSYSWSAYGEMVTHAIDTAMETGRD